MPPRRSQRVSNKMKQESESEDRTRSSSPDDSKLNQKSKKIQKIDKNPQRSKSTNTAKSKKKTAPPPKKGKASKKQEDSDQESDSSESEVQTKPKGSSFKGHTAQQHKRFNDLKIKLSNWNNQKLQNALKKNGQSSTGNKKDLILKVADGKTLGKIPRCPKCAGGRPRFDIKTGMYKCPGFRDDEDFVYCESKFSMKDLPREQWEKLSVESDSDDNLSDDSSNGLIFSKAIKASKKKAKKQSPKKKQKTKASTSRSRSRGQMKKESSSEDDDTDDDESEDSFKIKGYTKDQYEKYQQFLILLGNKTTNQLKDELKKNDQACSGLKDDLVAKVADGKTLGKIPRCPRCAGGRPRFDMNTGMYKCPGFRDDEDFVWCNKKYSLNELPREQWEE